MTNYNKAIEEMIEILLSDEQKEFGYSTLKQILKNYDMLVKEKASEKNENIKNNFELPYWCYGWCK